MRLLTFETAGRTRLGAEWRGGIVDLQNVVVLGELLDYGADAAAHARTSFPSDMLEYLRGGAESAALAQEALLLLETLPEQLVANHLLGGETALVYREEQVRRRAPVPRPGKIICLGLNYRDHAAESNMPVPKEPVLFCKYANTVIGPGDPIIAPRASAEVDYEAELVFVIGKGGRNIPASRAMEHVAGYTCGHDVSARDYQLRRGSGQWMVGKTWDTFAPMGPVLVTADHGIDPHNLPIRLILNGEVLQDSNTNQFVFDIPATVEYLSHVMTLEPGDVVFTGTPPGVGFARKPPVFLKAGDIVEVVIDGIGTLRNAVSSD